jgi:mannose-6-phosphate isomerase
VHEQKGILQVTAIKLSEKRVEKPWGVFDLPQMFGGTHPGSEPLGEIWFERPGGGDVELLVKYLFTSERLSIQVHPDDAGARRAGYKRGKDEAWIVLDASPVATIGLGLTKQSDVEELRAAALDGSIEDLVDWKSAKPGDILYSPARTVHALGAGLALIEIQQNLDLTYRLYDYGRPRELHLEDGIRASDLRPYATPFEPYVRPDGREILAAGLAFVLERWSAPLASTILGMPDTPVWLIPVDGAGTIAGEPLEEGSVWIAEGATAIQLAGGMQLYVAYPGGSVREDLLG